MKSRLILVSFAALTLMACTKERPYKEVGKDGIVGSTQFSKAVIDTNADYIYMASTLESARYAGSVRPHWSDPAKRVRFAFREDSLQVISPEEDGRFTQNTMNNAVVLSIPIEHVEYRCAPDDYGNCTHREEENRDLNWINKSQFRLKPAELATQQISFLPLEIANFFIGCYVEVGAEMISSVVTGDSLNFVLEKTFQAKPPCIGNIESLNDLTFSVRYQHSFVKLNKLASPDYKAIEYTKKDETNFGYFETERKVLDIDNSDVVASEKHFFDRWNPNRTVIYYLSANFAKPENAAIRQSTYDSFKVINDGLKSAGTALRFELKDPVEGMSSGDVRNSMIVLEEDPLAAGVIGYGPHASNPLTGEILSARVIMYLGTMKKYLKYNYDDLVKEKIAKAAGTLSTATRFTLSPELEAAMGAGPMVVGAGDSAVLNQINTQINTVLRNAQAKSRNQFVLQDPGLSSQINQAITRPGQLKTFTKDLQERATFMSKNCLYPADMINVSESIAEGVDKVIDEVGLKPWLELSDAERTKVIDILLPYVYLPTLIHELGHNLGLRHNFSGSVDKDNFYTPQELTDMGVKRPFEYSSVMDYGYRTNNELRVLGKYDIAALRYAYKEEVELADGSVTSLTSLHNNPGLELKPYRYCTDEHVDVNANCSRFDEGTSLTAMATHYVNAYEARYKRSNFRNNRRSFSQFGDSAQVGALDDTFSKMRMMFELYERIKNDYSVADDSPLWRSNDFLKDVHQATMIAGRFFLRVLKTPDLFCAIVKDQEPTKIIGILPIRELSTDAISCFDGTNIRLNPGFTIVAQGGKSFQSLKDPASDNHYADQIDIRGIFIDKLLAIHYLTVRELGNQIFDNYTENFIHFGPLQGEILGSFSELLMDELAGPVDFLTPRNEAFKVNIRYNLYSADPAKNSHKIVSLMDDYARLMLGLPAQESGFQVEMVKSILRNVPSQVHHEIGGALTNLFRVRTEVPRDGREAKYLGVDVGSQRFFVYESSDYSMQLAQSYTAVATLDSLGLTEAQINKVLAVIAQEEAAAPNPVTPTPVLTEQEQAAKAVGKDALQKYLRGGFQSPSYYALLIETLASLTH